MELIVWFVVSDSGIYKLGLWCGLCNGAAGGLGIRLVKNLYQLATKSVIYQRRYVLFVIFVCLLAVLASIAGLLFSWSDTPHFYLAFCISIRVYLTVSKYVELLA